MGSFLRQLLTDLGKRLCFIVFLKPCTFVQILKAEKVFVLERKKKK